MTERLRAFFGRTSVTSKAVKKCPPSPIQKCPKTPTLSNRGSCPSTPKAVQCPRRESCQLTPTPTKRQDHTDPLTPIIHEDRDPSSSFTFDNVELEPNSNRNQKMSLKLPSQDDDTLSEDSPFEDDETTLLNAIKNADYEALEDYVNDIDVNEMTSEGRRYLHECVCYDDQECCQIFLDNGANINARDEFGWTSLHFSAAFNLVEMTRFLLDKGADPRKKSHEDKLPEDYTEDEDICSLLSIARARRQLRSVSTISISDVEAANIAAAAAALKNS